MPRIVGIVGARVSFQEGHHLLADLAGIEVATKHIEGEAEHLGFEVLKTKDWSPRLITTVNF